MIRAFSSALLSLRRAPAFTSMAVLSLGFGVALNTTAFGFLERAVFQAPPFPNAEELFVLHDPRVTLRTLGQSEAATLVDALRDYGTVGSYRLGVGGQHALGLELAGERYEGVRLDMDAFRALGVRPAHGRLYTDEEERTGAPLVVLSHTAWRRGFAGEKSVIGQTVRIAGAVHTVVGIMPLGFAFPVDDTNFWVPIGMPHAVAAGGFSLIVRPTAGVARLEQVMQSTVLATSRGPQDVAYAPLVQAQRYSDDSAFYAMQIAVGLVFLLACVNISNLVLSRAAARSSTIALQSALGASPRSLSANAAAEAVIIGCAATMAGLAGAMALLELLQRVVPPGVFRRAIDGPVGTGTVLYVLASAVVAVAIVSIAPVMHASRIDLRGLLGSRAMGGPGSPRIARIRGTFVVVQIALSLILLADATMMLRVLQRAAEWVPDADVAGLVRGEVIATSGRIDAQDVTARLSAAAGVEAAAVAAPLGARSIAITGVGESVQCGCVGVSHGYIAVLGARMLAGRAFDEGDPRNTAYAVVDSVLVAQAGWESPSGAIGRTFIPEGSVQPVTVLGVIAPIRLIPPVGRQSHAAPGAAYVLSGHDSTSRLTVVARLHRASTVSVVREVLDALPVDVQRLMTADEHSDVVVNPFRWYASVFGALALLAAALAALGLYGVVSFATTRRMREIGIRLALGATPQSIRKLVLHSTMRLAGWGIAWGIAGAVITANVLRTVVPGSSAVTAAEGAGAATMVLLLVALVASAIPANRASRLNPSIVLNAP